MFPLYDATKFATWAAANNLIPVPTLAQAVWLTIDGTMYGTKDEQLLAPHTVQADVATYLAQFTVYNNLKITSNNFWSIVHEATGLVRVVYATEIVRTMIRQRLSEPQRRLIEQANYEIEPYTKNRHYFDDYTYNM
ncbi:hypothetical protein JOC59_000861 [Weissella beninensis]|uniref:Uncharacterized protein n=1 Tax=Periweissella beninensis TaxID=504936 RepID=A0ABT0VIM0_9LACO|nr:hypothetical protein [Periweissella beninensis]MBM7544146.1 hypothetical protein [Periweissella beninensis]MCM2437480.1 hypothetical protein [Periweissella beninensis]